MSDELRVKVNRGDYETKLPYFIRKANPEGRDAYKADKDRLDTLFQSDVRSYSDKFLGITMTDSQFNRFYQWAYDIGHSGGYSEILNYLDDMLDVIAKFVKK